MATDPAFSAYYRTCVYWFHPSVNTGKNWERITLEVMSKL